MQKDDNVGCICENTILPLKSNKNFRMVVSQINLVTKHHMIKLVSEKARVIIKCKQVTCTFPVLFMAPIVLHLRYRKGWSTISLRV